MIPGLWKWALGGLLVGISIPCVAYKAYTNSYQRLFPWVKL